MLIRKWITAAAVSLLTFIPFVVPANATGQVVAISTTRTGLAQTNPGTNGTGASLQGTPATWDSHVWSNPLTHSWYYRSGCSGTPRGFSLTSNGMRVGGLSLTVPATVWVEGSPGSNVFNTALDSNGLALAVDSFGSNNTHFSGSLSIAFLVGTGMCASMSGSPAGNTAAAPIKYSGPEFSGLSAMPVLSGSSATLEGRKLDQISSITVDGKAAKLSDATDKSLKLELPAGLAPGVYDLVVTTANHGKLTHMNAIRIREELVPTSLTIQGTGVLSGEEFKKLTAFARTQNSDMNTVTCIVNSGSEGKSFMQARALCDRIAATNLNIKTTQFEARSTFKSSAIFARVVFSHEESQD